MTRAVLGLRRVKAFEFCFIGETGRTTGCRVTMVSRANTLRGCGLSGLFETWTTVRSAVSGARCKPWGLIRSACALAEEPSTIILLQLFPASSTFGLLTVI